jgi:hypothetical protein
MKAISLIILIGLLSTLTSSSNTSVKLVIKSEHIRDVNKIFNNCRLFNPITSTCAQCANVVDTYFRQLLENLMIKDDN